MAPEFASDKEKTVKWVQSKKPIVCELEKLVAWHQDPSIFDGDSTIGYRNKCEFTIGYDENDKVSVGYLCGRTAERRHIIGCASRALNAPQIMKDVAVKTKELVMVRCHHCT